MVTVSVGDYVIQNPEGEVWEVVSVSRTQDGAVLRRYVPELTWARVTDLEDGTNPTYTLMKDA